MNPAWDGIARLLCIRVDSMGDVLMTTPAIRAFRQSLPRCEITLLTSPSGSALLPHVPEIDRVLVYRAPWMKGHDQDRSSAQALVARLRLARFDAAVIFTSYSQSALPAALLCMFAGIPRTLAHCRENPYRLLTDWIAEPEPEQRIRHETRRQLDLAAEVGARSADERLSFHITGKIRQGVAHLLERLGIAAERRVLAVHAGATAPSRRWPPEHFIAATKVLLRRLDCAVVFTGSGEEAALCDAMQHAVGEGSISLAGQLGLGELAALIARADVLLSNNSGPVHIAAALGTPVVDLYALTNPQHAPWQVPHQVLSHDVPCKYCYKSVCPYGHNDCLRKVAPEDAIEAVAGLWPRGAATPTPDDLLEKAV